MRILGKCLVSLSILGLLTLTARAQVEVKINPWVPMGFGGKLNVLQSEDVQKELKLSDEQVSKIKDLSEKQRNAFKDLPKDRQERIKKVQEIQKENQEREKTAADLLKPEQSKRLDQILLQQQGLAGMLSPKVAEQLKLTDEQKGKMKEVAGESNKELLEIFKGAQGDPEGMQKKMAEHRSKTNEKLIGVLTPEQQKQWKEMTGEPFKGKIANMGLFPGGGVRIPLPPGGVRPLEKKNEF